MKKNKLLLILFALVFVIQACVKDNETTDQKKAKENDEQIRQYLETNGITAERTSEGLYYNIINPQVTNKTPEIGNQVYVHYVGRLLNGNLFDSTKVSIDTTKGKDYAPLIFSYNSGAIIPGFNQGIGLMHKGQKAKFFIPSNLAYGNTLQNAKYSDVPAYSVLQFDVELLDIRTEDEALQKYIADKQLKNVKYTGSGLYFVSQNAGTDAVTGEIPKSGQTVSVKYTGLFLSGSKFDESQPNTPFTFKIGAQGAIPGFEEGIAQMKKGEKAIILIPSKLAYGVQGSRSIPPYTPLIFEVELLKIE